MNQTLVKIKNKTLFGYILESYEGEIPLNKVLVEHTNYEEVYNKDEVEEVSYVQLLQSVIGFELELYDEMIRTKDLETIKQWYYGNDYNTSNNKDEFKLPSRHEYYEFWRDSYRAMTFEDLKRAHYDMATGWYEE